MSGHDERIEVKELGVFVRYLFRAVVTVAAQWGASGRMKDYSEGVNAILRAHPRGLGPGTLLR